VLLKLRAQIHSFIDISLPKTPTCSFYIALPALHIQALCFLVLWAPFLVHDGPFTFISHQPAANSLAFAAVSLRLWKAQFRLCKRS
jgi:hypothetical protein